MGELCDYLKAKYDGQPNKNNLIVCENKRFTVITPYLLRIEEGTFCDNATQTVIKRNLGEVWFEYKNDNSDALAKFENALTHAQCSSLEKHKLHNVFKSRLSGKLDRKQMGEYCDTSLGGYLRELEQQLNLV